MANDVSPPPQGEPDEIDGLDVRRCRLVVLLMEGYGIPEIARETGYAQRTLYRMRKEPAVKAALRERMADAMGRARVVLTSGAVWAATALVEMAAGQDADSHLVVADPARVAACKAVLETAARLAESEDLADRVAELEAKLSGLKAEPKDDPAPTEGGEGAEQP